jgi:hypothetical protein
LIPFLLELPVDVKRVRFKLADKRAALVDRGRHLGVERFAAPSLPGG